MRFGVLDLLGFGWKMTIPRLYDSDHQFHLLSPSPQFTLHLGKYCEHSPIING